MYWSSNEVNPVDLVMEHRVLSTLFRWHRGRTRFAEVEVKVRCGVATLTGNVHSFYDRQVATATAIHVCGIHEIRDHLSVAEHAQNPLHSKRLPRSEVPR